MLFKYRIWLDSFDTPGGHILMLLMLIGVGILMVALHLAKGEDILIGAFGALLALLRGTTSNGSASHPL